MRVAFKFGPDHRLLIPLASLGGGAFLVFADTLARTRGGAASITRWRLRR